MTTVYFVRHAEPNYQNHNDIERELTKKGMEDRKLVTEYLKSKEIDVVLSSPYKRSVDTVKHFADSKSLPVEVIDDFRERKVDNVWIEDFDAFCKRQWENFLFKLSDGETLAEVQERNIAALQTVLCNYEEKNIVIGSHGTALSTIINYYDKSFGYEQFNAIKSIMPLIVKIVFNGYVMLSIEIINPFSFSKVTFDQFE